MPQRPFFSLIVPTLNRTEELAALLHSLCEQTFKDFEVIIVDQNEDDRASRAMGDFASRLSIRHIRQRARGGARARNEGLRHAAGEIITFPDDDCEYPPNLLQQVHEKLHDCTDLDGITGSCKAQCSSRSVSRMRSTQQAVNRYNVFWTSIEFTVFLRADRIKGVSFDEELGPGALTPWGADEGVDFIVRLIEKNQTRITYFPEIVVYHEDPANGYDAVAFARSYSYGCGRGKCLRKHRYPFWFVLYMWGLSIAGILLSCTQLNLKKALYYYRTLQGRMRGYIYPNRR